MLAAFPLAGCGPTKPPYADPTPPVLRWQAVDVTAATEKTYAAEATTFSDPQSQYFISLHAIDPGGLQSSALAGRFSWYCINASRASLHTSKLSVPAPYTASFHGLGSLPTLHSASVPVDPRVISCKAGDEVLGAQVLLVGHATNFSGREAKAILTMFFSPHEGTPPAPSQTTGAPSR